MLLHRVMDLLAGGGPDFDPGGHPAQVTGALGFLRLHGGHAGHHNEREQLREGVPAETASAPAAAAGAGDLLGCRQRSSRIRCLLLSSFLLGSRGTTKGHPSSGFSCVPLLPQGLNQRQSLSRSIWSYPHMKRTIGFYMNAFFSSTTYKVPKTFFQMSHVTCKVDNLSLGDKQCCMCLILHHGSSPHHNNGLS